ncbi:hypothetical protein [Bradyrhizobium sp. I1.7.5]|uniref:hypothetical protein n=1 Tax=Bradyrhizobium sp. I1.7.5 TaxID=3156363 RepID=UPI00339468E7
MTFIVQATSNKPGEGSFTVSKATGKDALETAVGLLGQGLSSVTITGDGRVYSTVEFSKTMGDPN